MTQQPNHFELEGKDTKVTYSTESFSGPPQLTYQDSERTISALGDDFHTEKTALGKVVSMTVEIVPDGWTRSVSVLIPLVHLGDGQSPAVVKTLAIFSRRKSHIAGPGAVQGQVTTFETLDLAGMASQVEF